MGQIFDVLAVLTRKRLFQESDCVSAAIRIHVQCIFGMFLFVPVLYCSALCESWEPNWLVNLLLPQLRVAFELVEKPAQKRREEKKCDVY